MKKVKVPETMSSSNALGSWFIPIPIRHIAEVNTIVSLIIAPPHRLKTDKRNSFSTENLRKNWALEVRQIKTHKKVGEGEPSITWISSHAKTWLKSDNFISEVQSTRQWLIVSEWENLLFSKRFFLSDCPLF